MKIEIQGYPVEVDDAFGGLAPEHQSAVIEDIIANARMQNPNAFQKGNLLPVSTDAQGNPHLDPLGAGFTGALLGAASLPGDVATGKQPIMTGTGAPDPALMQRTLGLAATITPTATPMGGWGLKSRPGPKGIPTTTELRNAGGAGYDAARGLGLDVSSNVASDLATSLQQDLTGQHGIIPKTAPQTYAILDELANPPPGGYITVPGLLAARQGLSGLAGSGGAEGLAARIARDRLDQRISTLGGADVLNSAPGGARAGGQTTISPLAAPGAAEQLGGLLGDANGNYAAGMRSNLITGDLSAATTGLGERAEGRAAASNSGHNLDNATRQRAASLLENPSALAGFQPNEIAALEAVRDGSFLQNRLRSIGNALGGGGGLGHVASMGAGAMAGNLAHGGTEGMAIGAAALPAIGHIAKAIQNWMAKRALNSADETIRMNSPLYQAWQRLQPSYGMSLAPALVQGTLRAQMPGVLDSYLPPAMPQGPGLLPGA